MRETIGPNELFRPRIRRLLASIRAVFAAFSLFAIWMDPSQPTSYPETAYYLLALYTVYSAVMAGVHWAAAIVGSRFRLAELVTDMLVFSLLMFLTEGPTSPFFLWFNFIILSATLTGGWRTAVVTSVLVTLLYMGVSGTFYLVRPEPIEVEWDRMLIRSGYLVLTGLLLAYFTREQERIGSEFARVLNWTGRGGDPVRPPLQEVLAHAMSVSEASRALVIWSEMDEPLVNLATLREGRFETEEAGVDLADALDGAHLNFIRQADGRSLILEGDRIRVEPWFSLPAELEEQLGARSLLSHGVRTDRIEGRLLLARDRPFGPEDLSVGVLLAAQVGVGLDRTLAVAAWREALGAEDRVRLARDLHDGILQSLAGTALQLNRIAEDGGGDAEALRGRVRVLETLLADEQRQLRYFIERLRPGSDRRASGEFDVGEDFGRLAEKLQLQWGVSVTASAPQALSAPRTLHFDLHQILREAVANSVRHGEADEVWIEARAEGPALFLSVKDNGGGLVQHGRFDDAQVAGGLGSRSLRDRVRRLSGAMTLVSAPSGLQVDITIPHLQQAG